MKRPDWRTDRLAVTAVTTVVAIALFFMALLSQADSELEERHFLSEMRRIDEEIRRLRAEYRTQFATRIRDLKRVELTTVDFDNAVPEAFKDLQGQDEIVIAPYGLTVPVLKTIVVTEPADRKLLLGALAGQITKPRHSGGALSHYATHGLRVYDGDVLVFETTFCWKSRNFGFRYPRGSDWLDTSDELEKLVTRLLPKPPKQTQRSEKLENQ